MKIFCNIFIFLFMLFLSCEGSELLLQPPIKSEQADIDMYANAIKYGGSFSEKNQYRHIVYLRKMKERNLYVEIRFFNQLPNELTPKEKMLFKKYPDNTSGIDSVVYIYQSQYDLDPYLTRRRRELFNEDPADRLAEKKIRVLKREFENPGCEFISVEDCAYMIKKSNRVIFLIGAGISTGLGIATEPELERSTGFEKDKAVDPLFKYLIYNPQEIFEKITALLFDPSINVETPSKAHFALVKLAFYKQSQVITTNFDLFLERAGIKSYKTKKAALENDWNRNVIKQIDTVVCIGCSEDHYAILGKYKKANPLGNIIIINREIPKYAGKDDFLVQGDIQVVVPRLASLVIDEDDYNDLNI